VKRTQKTTQLLFSALVACLLMQSTYASDVQTKIQSVFGDKPAVVTEYDNHLKKVVVNGTKVYFATHDGRYLFGGPIIDTEQRKNIVSLQENQLRKTYLSSLPEEVFVSYPSSTENKHKITVITDIDCPYCRKFHGHMKSLNQRGVSVNYVMLPRSGVGSASHVKTVAALCSDNPADSITNAMQNENLAPHECESNVMNQHLDIVRDLKITSTPTIILPNGQLKLGLVSPDQLLALIEATN
jgi:thiol:disulfide interchange protein DsbC